MIVIKLIFSISSSAGGSNPAGTYPYPFSTPAGQS